MRYDALDASAALAWATCTAFWGCGVAILDEARLARVEAARRRLVPADVLLLGGDDWDDPLACGGGAIAAGASALTQT